MAQWKRIEHYFHLQIASNREAFIECRGSRWDWYVYAGIMMIDWGETQDRPGETFSGLTEAKHKVDLAIKRLGWVIENEEKSDNAGLSS